MGQSYARPSRAGHLLSGAFGLLALLLLLAAAPNPARADATSPACNLAFNASQPSCSEAAAYRSAEVCRFAFNQSSAGDCTGAAAFRQRDLCRYVFDQPGATDCSAAADSRATALCRYLSDQSSAYNCVGAADGRARALCRFAFDQPSASDCSDAAQRRLNTTCDKLFDQPYSNCPADAAARTAALLAYTGLSAVPGLAASTVGAGSATIDRVAKEPGQEYDEDGNGPGLRADADRSMESAIQLFREYTPDAVNDLTDVQLDDPSAGAATGGFISTNPRDGFTVATQGDALTVAPAQVGAQVAAQNASPTAVVYSAIAPSTNMAVSPTPGGLSAYVQLVDGAAAPDFGFAIGAPANIRIRPASDGSIVVERMDGTPVGRIGAPSARDARGRAVPTSYTASGRGFNVAADRSASTIAYPVTIQVPVRAADADDGLMAAMSKDEYCGVFSCSTREISEGSTSTAGSEDEDALDDETDAASQSAESPATSTRTTAATPRAAWENVPQNETCNGAYRRSAAWLGTETRDQALGPNVLNDFIVAPPIVRQVANAIPTIRMELFRFANGRKQGGPSKPAVSPYYVLHSDLYKLNGYRGKRQRYLRYGDKVRVNGVASGVSRNGSYFANLLVDCKVRR